MLSLKPMKKTLSRKLIGGREYFYLMYREKGKLVTKYLGPSGSPKYRKYLLELIDEGGADAFADCRREAFAAGVPVAYKDGGRIVLEYRNGVKELLDAKLAVKKVVKP